MVSYRYFFGIDGVVKFHGDKANLSVLFAHETYHCYQSQHNPQVMLASQPPLFAGLWIEGGATWVSKQLNANASSLDVLLDDKALAAISREQIRLAANTLLKKCDSTEQGDSDAFFSAGWSGPWPARAGYLLGFHLARRIAPSLSAAAFASLSIQDIRSLYIPRLTTIANGDDLYA